MVIVTGCSVNDELNDTNDESAVFPRSRCKHAVCLRAGVVYVFGGKDANIPLNDVWSYDIETGLWKRIMLHGERLPALQEHTVILYKNDLYIFGGSFSYGSDNAAPLWVVDIDKSTCTKLLTTDVVADIKTQTNGSCPSQTSCPVGRRGHTAVLYGNSMYIYGGYVDMKGSSSELWQFSFDETRWAVVSGPVSGAESPAGRHSHSAVVHRRRMWIYGGLSDLTALDDLWTWHFDVQKWVHIRCRFSPAALEGHSACVVGNSMFVYGGCSDGAPQNSLWQFDFDFLAWTRLSVDGFTPTPCVKHCAVVVAQHYTTRRNHSLPTLRSKSSGGADLQRASTGRGHRRHRLTDVSVPLSRPILTSQQSVETTLTELRSPGSECNENTEEEKLSANGCCDACTSTLRRNHRVSSQPSPFDNYDTVFNSSREQLILEPYSDVISAAAALSQTKNVKLSPASTDFTADCTNTSCSCHLGTDNPTFVTSDVTLQLGEGYVESESGCRDHVIAAQALMQPVSRHQTVELSETGQTVFDAPVEMACYSLCQNGSRLVIEDLESDGAVEPSDTTLVELNGVGRLPWKVREAWPDKSIVPFPDSDLNDATSQGQLLSPDNKMQPETNYSIYIFGGRSLSSAPNLHVTPMSISRLDISYGT